VEALEDVGGGEGLRTIVAEDEDGTQVLVTIYDTGPPEVALRGGPGEVWGPPLDIKEDAED
jgi:hypothetical protein